MQLILNPAGHFVLVATFPILHGLLTRDRASIIFLGKRHNGKKLIEPSARSIPGLLRHGEHRSSPSCPYLPCLPKQTRMGLHREVQLSWKIFDHGLVRHTIPETA